MLVEPAKGVRAMPAPRFTQSCLKAAEGASRGMHPKSHGFVCTLRVTRCPSLASAGVAEDWAGSGRSLSVGI